ncbi:MAG: lipopolysaccharide biosynthesis protein [Dysgonamonadaceae bacterium]|nr:lipopolysaccharide biosynthesis protein [Dysgonamonadaceae bacterium]
MTASTLKQKTAKGLFWGGISSGVQQLISLGFGIYLARVLAVDDYGLVGMLAIFSGLAAAIINSGFSVALINKKEATHQDYNAVFWFALFTGLFLYIVLFFAAPLIAHFFRRPELINVSRILFLNFLFMGISFVPYTVMIKQLMIKQQAIIDIASALVSSTIGVILAINGFAYWALVIQYVMLMFLGTALRCVVSPYRPTFNIDFTPLKSMFSFSIKLFITDIFSQVNTHLFSFILGKFYDAVQLGYYSQGQKWMGMGQQLIRGMMHPVSQPILVQIQEERERQVAILRKLIRFGAFISFPLLLGLAFVGKEFILIAIGEKWLPSVPFLQLFCIWGAFCYLWTIFTNLLFTHGKSNIHMYITLFTGILQLVTALCTYHLGIFSMIFAYVIVNFIGLLAYQYHVKRLIGLRLRDILKDISIYLAITLACFSVAWLITRNIENPYYLLGTKIVISAGLYIFVLKISNSVIFKESVGFLKKK